MQPDEEPESDWVRHSYRILNLVLRVRFNVGSMHKTVRSMRSHVGGRERLWLRIVIVQTVPRRASWSDLVFVVSPRRTSDSRRKGLWLAAITPRDLRGGFTCRANVLASGCRSTRRTRPSTADRREKSFV